MKNKKYNGHYFDVIDSPSKAYFLGYSLADATITKYWYEKENKFFYRFKLNPNIQDIKIIQRFANEINSDFKIVETYTYKRKEPYINSVIEIKSKHLVETLINNFGGDTKDKRITYNVPENYKSHFIRGYFDGDGTASNEEVCLSGRIPILNKIMNDIKIYTSITKDKSIYRIRIRKKEDIYNFLKYIYSEVNFDEDLPLYLERKYEKIKHII